MKTVLLIEDKPYVRENLIAILESCQDFFRVLSAKNLMEATDVIDTLQIDAVILGLNLDPAEIDILDYHLKEKSKANLIVIHDGKSSLSKVYEKLRNKTPVKMPVDPDRLLEIVIRLLGIDYGGHIRGINLASFLQMIQLEAKTGAIKVLSGDKIGELYFETGNLVTAKTGKWIGKQAILEILKWDKPLISMTYQTRKVKRDIDESLMGILLEGSRLNDDDGGKGAAELRKFKRFECAQEIIFHVDDLIYRGIIRDVSMGGIFIETGVQIAAGKEIMLTLEDPESMKPDFLSGRVVRSNDIGVGVEFNELRIDQKNLVKSLIHDANLTEEV